MPVKHFNTEKEAEQAKRKYAKYKNTSNFRWVVQGNSLVRVKKR